MDAVHRSAKLGFGESTLTRHSLAAQARTRRGQETHPSTRRKANSRLALSVAGQRVAGDRRLK
jgi:hypothetical protein